MSRYDDRYLTHQGERLTVAAWAKRYGLSPDTIVRRLDAYDMTIAEALESPVARHRRYSHIGDAIAAYLAAHPEEARRYVNRQVSTQGPEVERGGV
jgi:hypothetical protein